jgi:hypothetical protein
VNHASRLTATDFCNKIGTKRTYPIRAADVGLKIESGRPVQVAATFNLAA